MMEVNAMTEPSGASAKPADWARLAVEAVPLRRIDARDDRWCARPTLRGLELAPEMIRHGQQVPLVLRSRGSATLQIVCGFRRFAAARHLGWPSLQAVVLRQLSDRAAFAMAVLDNEATQSLVGTERAHAFLHFHSVGRQFGLTEVHGVRPSQAQCAQLARWLTIAPCLQEAVATLRLRPVHALMLARAAEARGCEVRPWLAQVQTQPESLEPLLHRLASETMPV
jgi:ParB/RepB/Spo0J family partition protein